MHILISRVEGGVKTAFLSSSQVIDASACRLESRKVQLPRGEETLFISGYVTFSETPEAGQFASSWDTQSSWDHKAEETTKLEHEG